MLAKQDLPKVTKVNSSTALSNEEAFDMMSGFLASEKTKERSLGLTGEEYLASSSQTWSELRLAANSLLEEGDATREAVAPWREENSMEVASTPEQAAKIASVIPETEESKEDRKAKKSAKKEKKEAKKAKKEVKKAKKEEKKRKRDSL
jgi:nucleolar protein 58